MIVKTRHLGILQGPTMRYVCTYTWSKIHRKWTYAHVHHFWNDDTVLNQNTLKLNVSRVRAVERFHCSIIHVRTVPHTLPWQCTLHGMYTTYYSKYRHVHERRDNVHYTLLHKEGDMLKDHQPSIMGSWLAGEIPTERSLVRQRYVYIVE